MINSLSVRSRIEMRADADTTIGEAGVQRKRKRGGDTLWSRIGVALLPCYLGDGDHGLERVLADPVAALATELWMVTHRDLRSTARVRAFFDVVGGGMSGEQSVFEGRSG